MISRSDTGQPDGTATGGYDPHPLTERLQRARQGSGLVHPSSGECPPGLDAAWLVQAARWAGRRVPGWKVAVNGEGVPVFAPLDPLEVADPVAALPAGIRIEVELAFVLAADLPFRPSRPYRREEILERVGGVRLGIEVLGSRIAADSEPPPFPLLLADELGNDGYWLGPEVVDWDRDARLTIGTQDAVLFDAPARHPQGDPLLPLTLHAARDAAGWGNFVAGQVVTTGSLCGVLTTPAAGMMTIGLCEAVMAARIT